MVSDEVSQFLKEAAQLRDQQIQEDQRRSSQLEEEILAARLERQARRAERARSISPQKSSPASTPPPPIRQDSPSIAFIPPLDGATLSESPVSTFTPILEPNPNPATQPPEHEMSSRHSRSLSASPTKESDSPFDPDEKRSGFTLNAAPPRAMSWQRRPTSQLPEGTSRNRPLSMVATENRAQARQRSKTGPSMPMAATEGGFPRAQASHPRDPVDGDHDSMAPEPLKFDRRGSIPGPPRHSALISPPLGFPGAARLDPPSADAAGEEFLTHSSGMISSRSGNASPNRATSPTKGLGGFVQSAMMKRSDSVKRWSVTSPPGLTRADSVASNRNSMMAAMPYTTKSRPTSRPASRPVSRHGVDDSDAKSTTSASAHAAAATEADVESDAADTHAAEKSFEEDEQKSPPMSPTKTMDPRRWSPTKSSWLETALNKPDSPKVKHTPNASVSQPSWMVDLNKAKAAKTGTDAGRVGPPPKHEVSIGGLMRHSPMGAGVKPSQVGLGGVYSPPAALSQQRPITGSTVNLRSTFSKSTSSTTSQSSALDGAPETANAKESPTFAKVSPAFARESAFAKEGPAPAKESPPLEAGGVKDFRANLRSRHQKTPSSTGGDVPEFKSVFGTLRKTKTQNYVAPDELKDNILRGKAALSSTGGPKKSERVDELKEAILKKRAEFKQAQAEGKGIAAQPKVAQEQPLPEGLTRRAEIGRSGTISFARKQQSTPDLNAEALRRPSLPSFELPMPDMTRLDIEPESESRPSSEPVPEPAKPVVRELPSPPKPLPRQLSSPPLGQQRLPPRELPPPPAPVPAAAAVVESNESSRSRPQMGGGLTGRMNTNLANLLARGPPPMVSGASNGLETGSGETGDAPAPGPQLTHMTKNRARGPRRKAPSSTASAAPASQARPAATTPSTERRISRPTTSHGPATQPESFFSAVPQREPESPYRYQQHQQQQAAQEQAQTTPQPTPSRKRASTMFSRPRNEPTTSSLVSSPSLSSTATTAQSSSPAKTATERLSQPTRSPTEASSGGPSQPASPRKLDVRRMSMFMEDRPHIAPYSEPSRERALPISTEDLVPKPLATRSRSQSPTKVPERLPDQASSPRKDAKVDMEPSVIHLRRGSPPSPILLGPTFHSPTQTSASVFEMPPPPPPQAAERSRPVSRSSVKTPPMGAPPLPPSRSFSRPPTRPGSPNRSPTRQRLEASMLLEEFFGSQRPQRDYRVDSAAILMDKQPAPPRIKTMSATLYQILGPGKKTQVSAHHERELFEQNMYVCFHTYMNEVAKIISEVYFWVGDDVPSSAVRDVESFVASDAKAMGGTLIKLVQGAESPEFLQALGGIVIIRRGSINKYDSLAPSMLCGRRYRGQVTFDEVEFSASSLCSGFPFLITWNGRCFLWIGKGSDVDELSCARLIGMDLTLTGELEEIEDGDEPVSFWNIFGGGPQISSADHWRLKPNYNRYCGRLFCADGSTAQQVVEIKPFRQRDMLRSNVYILDAFFEMYVIVGAKAQSQYGAFRTALEFAQEYAILASGMEDRPFIPISTVVLEGIPRDLKSVFRKWKDIDSPTIMPSPNQPKVGGGLKRGRSLRVVPLTQALAAMND